MVDFFLGIYHNYVKSFGALVYPMYTLVHLLLGVVSFNEYIAYLPIQIEKKLKKPTSPSQFLLWCTNFDEVFNEQLNMGLQILQR